MSQYGQMNKILHSTALPKHCDFSIQTHFHRIEHSDTSLNIPVQCTAVIPKCHLDTPKHHSRQPHMFKTDYRHQHTPTDTNRHHQTFSNTPRHHSEGGWQCLGVPGAVLGCLVLSGGVLCCLGVDRKMLRAVWDAFMGVSGTWVSLGCYPRAQPLRDRAWIKQLYHVSTTPNNKICFTWLY